MIKPRTIWPALIFAARRKDSVIGRTIILIVSIITRAGASQLGAPDGRSLALNSFGELIIEEITKESQIGRPNAMVKRR